MGRPPAVSDSNSIQDSYVALLTWEQVDLSRKLAWIPPDQAKARNAIAVPLNETAMNIVRPQRP